MLMNTGTTMTTTTDMIIMTMCMNIILRRSMATADRQ